jgi:hypothetical protein
MSRDRFFVSIEFGMANESTAIAVLQQPYVDSKTPVEKSRPVYSLRHLHRFPIGTSYP